VQPKAARAEHKISQSQDKKTLSLPAVAPSKAPDGFGADGNLLSMARQADAQKGLVTSAVPPVPASGNAQWNSEAAAQDRRSALARRASEMNAGIISKLAIEAPPPPAPVPPDLTAVHGDLMAPATGGPRPLAAEADASRQMERMPQPVNGLAVLHLTRQPRLPSGLDAVSSAVMLDRILAVDPEGAVFLSRDATKHWERVPIQWTGKAIAVRAPEFYPLNAAVQNDAALHTSPIASVSITPAPPVPAPAAPPLAGQSPATPPAGSAPPAPPPAPADAKAALAVPGMLFKLINDHRQTWVSADGKVWHEQQGSE
jgi:hypothetical protein